VPLAFGLAGTTVTAPRIAVAARDSIAIAAVAALSCFTVFSNPTPLIK